MHNMFNMKEIGKNISTLRKEKDLTQLELADKLGITYQAVSNWERGDSMPDISKLSELSTILDVSIDELLGNSKATEAIEKIINAEKINVNDLERDELESILPLVKPKQFEESFEDSYDVSFEKIIMMAPFLDEEELEKMVSNQKELIKSSKIVALAPFVSKSFLSEIVVMNAKSDDFDLDTVIGLAPFMTKNALGILAMKIYEKHGVSEIVGLAPFLKSDVIKEIVEIENQKQNPDSVVALLPFIGEESFNVSDILKMFGKKKK